MHAKDENGMVVAIHKFLFAEGEYDPYTINDSTLAVFKALYHDVMSQVDNFYVQSWPYHGHDNTMAEISNT